METKTGKTGKEGETAVLAAVQLLLEKGIAALFDDGLLSGIIIAVRISIRGF